MAKLEDSEISIVTVQAVNEQHGIGMFPSPDKVIAKFGKVQAKILQENLSEVTQILSDIVDNLPATPKGCFVDSVTFSLSIDNSGKISLVGELSGAIKSGITITIKRNYGDHLG